MICMCIQEEEEDGIDRSDGFVLMKDWSYFRWGFFIFLSICTALAFIFALVGSHAIENRKMASTDQ